MKVKKWIFIASCMLIIALAILRMIFPNEIGNIFYVALALSSALTYFLFFRPHEKVKNEPTEKLCSPKMKFVE